jgi:glutaminyl-tRNA synthetase
VLQPLEADPARAHGATFTGDAPGSRYQFERTGYFTSDVIDSKPGALVFNRTVTLRDTWAKIEKAEGRGQ